MQDIRLRSSGMRRKQNWVPKWQSSLDVYFSLSLLSSFSPFLPHCFYFSGNLVGFLLEGKVFRKTFRILELYERKRRRVVEQDFHGNFQINVTFFFPFFSSVLDWIELILEWFERYFHSSQVRGGQNWPWSLQVVTSQAVEGMWIRTGGYRLTAALRYTSSRDSYIHTYIGIQVIYIVMTEA